MNTEETSSEYGVNLDEDSLPSPHLEPKNLIELLSFVISFKSMALLLLVLLSLSASPATADPPSHICGTSSENFTSNGTYNSNLNHLISILSSNASATGFATSIIGSIPNRVCGLTMCRGDIDTANCRSCISAAFSDIQQLCPNSKDATIWYDYCQLRYSNVDFLEAPDVTMSMQEILYNSMTVPADRLSLFQFLTTALIGNITDLAVKNTSSFFATGETALTAVDNIFGMVQCTPDLSVGDCRTCLQGTVEEITEDPLNGKRGGRVLGLWCFMRYELYKFYNGTSMLMLSMDQQSSAPPPANVLGPSPTKQDWSPGGISTGVTAIAITLPLVGLVILTTACFCFWRKRSKAKITRGTNPEEITNVESIFFDLSTLKIATTNFSECNKLGEGGFGSVYMGLLPDGREIAVKRLSTGSKQGLDELRNELILVAKLQHRNLVRLHGICLEEQERLLVYEYLPNKSLDTILFDPTKSELLDWEKRYKIIEGIARGLLYLHEDSQLRIIHRDLKASNILLDAKMNPKIGDFGLAKLFGREDTYGMTSHVVGTYGYMAPEYGMHGNFSVKSDVFSFGVLILELITGRSIGCFNVELDEDLLSYVWKNWKNGTILKILDHALRKLFRNSEVIKCIHIGLLCVQMDPAQRPTMTQVIVMLNSHSVSLKTPSSPAFFVERSGIKTSTISKKSNMHGDGPHKSPSEFISMSLNELSISELDPR